MSTFDKIVQSFEQNRMKSKEQFLIELEETFNNSSWDDIINLIVEVNRIDKRDEVVDNIIQYVNEKNKITFKQWKVLRLFLKNNDGKKFKHGN